METKSLLRLEDYEWDTQTEQKWRRRLLPLTAACVAIFASAVGSFLMNRFEWASIGGIGFVGVALISILSPLKSAPLSLRSGKPMKAYRNLDSRRDEFEIIYLDEETKSYFTHTVFQWKDADAE